MSRKFQAPKGTRDLLPPETALWAAVEETARRVFALYCFREIRTPLFEDTELFARGVGETTDIVGKEMYSFLDKGERNLTLRPESTASVCRAYVEHGMQTLPQPVKLYYIGPQFRYERPQKGRYRQFHQIGAELLGGRGAEADVEVLLLLVAFLKSLDFTDLKVFLNTVGDAESRALYRDRLVEYLRPHVDRLSEESRRRLETNPLRILDTKSPDEQKLLEGAPGLTDCLTPASRERFSAVCSYLKAFDVAFEISPRLVRGLDYYTNTVFEIVSEGLGAQNAICGGGAYEKLVEELGGPPTYGVGFAIGEDRLVEVLPKSFQVRKQELQPVRVEGMGTLRKRWTGEGPSPIAQLVEALRSNGIPTSIAQKSQNPTTDSIRGLESPWIYLGDEELASNEISLKLPGREQRRASLADAIRELHAHYSSDLR